MRLKFGIKAGPVWEKILFDSLSIACIHLSLSSFFISTTFDLNLYFSSYIYLVLVMRKLFAEEETLNAKEQELMKM